MSSIINADKIILNIFFLSENRYIIMAIDISKIDTAFKINDEKNIAIKKTIIKST